MSESAAASEPTLAPIVRRRGSLGVVAHVLPDRLTTALVALLAAAWIGEGALRLVGLPHGLIGVVDAGEATLCAWLAVLMIRERRRGPILALSIYGAWVLSGLLVTQAPTASVVTAAKDSLLLPTLAVFLATRNSSERRVAAVVTSLFLLGSLQLVLTVWQAFHVSDYDQIVGSFGPSANAVIGAVVLLTAAVGFAGYLVDAPLSRVALAGAVVLPLFSAWTIVKIATLALPVIAIAVAWPALALRRTTRRRAATCLLAAILSSTVVIGSYAAFNPDNFSALVSLRQLENYLRSGAATGIAGAQVAQADGVVVSDYFNASVAVPRRATTRGLFQIGNATAGDYTSYLISAGRQSTAVRAGRSYRFSAEVLGAGKVVQTIQPQIEWHTATGRVISVTEGTLTTLNGGKDRPRLISVIGVGPAGATSAKPKLAVANDPPLGSSIYAWSLHFRGAPGGPVPTPLTSQAPPAGPLRAGAPLPGHLTLLRRAVSGIAGTLATELFGKGLGSATVAAELGGSNQHLSAGAAAASNSDTGTLVYERGWVGFCLAVALALALFATAVRTVRARPPRSWVTASTLAVPAAVAVMAGYSLIGTLLQNRAAALTFWLIVGLGLSGASVRRD